jgi:tight adherence protein C
VEAVLALVGIVAAAALLFLVRGLNVHRSALERLQASGDELGAASSGDVLSHTSWTRRWLFVAGFRGDAAVPLFMAATAAAVLLAIGAAVLIQMFLVDLLVGQVVGIPGGMGDAMATMLEGGPWIVGATLALAPVLVVRARRRQLVREVERDLPIVLELFAALAQAGLGFDAALSRIVANNPPGRPLIAEFMAFQRDLLAGVPRVQALRHFAQRLDVPTVTAFISAVVQAEQIGASVADVLRQQADDLRARRREQALLQAQALPVKLVVPLIVCFLPSIFVSTLAPVLYQMLQITNTLFRTPGR